MFGVTLFRKTTSLTHYLQFKDVVKIGSVGQLIHSHLITEHDKVIGRSFKVKSKFGSRTCRMDAWLTLNLG